MAFQKMNPPGRPGCDYFFFFFAAAFLTGFFAAFFFALAMMESPEPDAMENTSFANALRDVTEHNTHRRFHRQQNIFFRIITRAPMMRRLAARLTIKLSFNPP